PERATAAPGARPDPGRGKPARGPARPRTGGGRPEDASSPLRPDHGAAVTMAFRVFEPSYEFIDGRLDEFLGSRLSAVIAEVEGPLRIALVLYVVLYGFAILRGAIAEPVMDFAVRSIKLALVYALATTTAYSGFVTAPLFTGLPNVLTRAVSGAEAP